MVPVLFTFYIQSVLKLKKNNSGVKRLTFALRRVAVDFILPCMRSACSRNLVLVFPLRFDSKSADFHLVHSYQLRDIPTPYSSFSASSSASHLNRLQYLPLKLLPIPKIVVSRQTLLFNVILRAVARLWEATDSFVMSVCLSVCLSVCSSA